MAHPELNWNPASTDETTIANIRHALAVLRVYRYVNLPVDEHNFSYIVRPMWPLIRQFPALFMQAAPKGKPTAARHTSRRRGSFDESEVREAFQAARSTPRRLAEEPGGTVLEYLATALVEHSGGAAPLFDAVEARLVELAAARTAPTDACVDVLASILSLSAHERDFLRLAVAVDRSSIDSSYFSLARAPSRVFTGVRVAIGAKDDHQVRAMFSRSAKLMRSGLLETKGLGARPDMEDILRISGRALTLLGSGTHTVQEMADVVLQRLPPAAGPGLQWPHLADRTALAEQVLRHALQRREPGINLLLYGEPGTGKTQFAAQLVTGAGAQGFTVTDMDSQGDAATRDERLSSLLLSQIFAPGGRSVIVLDEAEDIFQSEYNSPLGRAFGKKDEAKSWMNHLLEDNRNPVIWITNRIDHLDPAYLRRFTYCMEFPRPPRAVRRTIALGHLEAIGCSPALIEEVATEPLVTPALLASAARVVGLVGLRGDDADAVARLTLQDMVKASGGAWRAQVPERSTRFDMAYLNVKGAISATSVLEGVARRGQGRVLLSGPPGTGKTQFAAEIAARTGRELVYKTASDINSMWYGQSERNVASMFTECDAAAEVLFLDEADTLMGSRAGGGHRADVAVTAEFLRQVEAFKGVFVCATNFQAQIDPALMRRFEFRLDMLPLTRVQRTGLFCEAALGWSPEDGPQPALDGFTRNALDALDALTPGDFANVVRRVRSLGLQLDARGWIAELQAEHESKPGGGRAPIGFLA